MTVDEAAELVGRYYAAFRAGSPESVAEALAAVLAPDFTLDSPLVQDRFGAPVSGAAATAVAVRATALLRHAEVESLHFTTNATGVVALIRLPTPGGVIRQSEHLALDPVARTLTGLRSFYDPRGLLDTAPAAE
ncbi:MAG: hypothetical protein ACTHNS_00580 [Marmoricola sp.]